MVGGGRAVERIRIVHMFPGVVLILQLPCQVELRNLVTLSSWVSPREFRRSIRDTGSSVVRVVVGSRVARVVQVDRRHIVELFRKGGLGARPGVDCNTFTWL